MKEIKNKIKEEMNDTKSSVSVDAAAVILKGERVRLGLGLKDQKIGRLEDCKIDRGMWL